MKKIILFLALLLATPAPAQPPTILERSFNSIVRVEAPNREDPKNTVFCTGIVVGIVHVLTAEHCIPKDDGDVKVETRHARVVRKGEWLVLLEMAEPLNKRVATFASANPPIGTDVTATGWVDRVGTRLSLRRSVASVEQDTLLFIDGPLIPGMSGGPVINAAGEVVGVSQASNVFTGMISSTRAVKEFLK